MGWKIEGTIPDNINKLVMLGAPHTSNWDFLMMMCCAWHYGLTVKWLGKESLFATPIMKFLSTFMGGIRVERGHPQQAVDSIAQAIISSKQRLCLAIAPEGSRHKKAGWRSGFFHIAKTAGVPIGLGYIDYARQVMGVGPVLTDVRDIDSVMLIMQDFYKNVTGKHPEKQSPIQIIKS